MNKKQKQILDLCLRTFAMTVLAHKIISENDIKTAIKAIESGLDEGKDA